MFLIRQWAIHIRQSTGHFKESLSRRVAEQGRLARLPGISTLIDDPFYSVAGPPVPLSFPFPNTKTLNFQRKMAI